MLRKNSQISTKINPFYTSPPPLFNTLFNHPKPCDPLFYKSFHRPHKIILTFYFHLPTFPYFVAQKKATPHSVTNLFSLFFYLKKRGNEFLIKFPLFLNFLNIDKCHHKTQGVLCCLPSIRSNFYFGSPLAHKLPFLPLHELKELYTHLTCIL